MTLNDDRPIFIAPYLRKHESGWIVRDSTLAILGRSLVRSLLIACLGAIALNLPIGEARTPLGHSMFLMAAGFMLHSLVLSRLRRSWLLITDSADTFISTPNGVKHCKMLFPESSIHLQHVAINESTYGPSNINILSIDDGTSRIILDIFDDNDSSSLTVAASIVDIFNRMPNVASVTNELLRTVITDQGEVQSVKLLRRNDATIRHIYDLPDGGFRVGDEISLTRSLFAIGLLAIVILVAALARESVPPLTIALSAILVVIACVIVGNHIISDISLVPGDRLMTIRWLVQSKTIPFERLIAVYIVSYSMDASLLHQINVVDTSGQIMTLTNTADIDVARQLASRVSQMAFIRFVGMI